MVAPATCLEHLMQMRQGGFKVVLNYSQWSSTAQELLAYARTAQALGMKIIWPLNAPVWINGSGLPAYYPALRADCGCSDSRSFLSYVIGLVRDLPATWGYYIGDETPASQLPAVTQLAAQIRTLDPRHPLLYIGNGMAAAPAAQVTPFAQVADVVGSDAYPVGWPASAPEFVSDVGLADREAAADGNAQTAMVLQAFSWAQYPAEAAPPAPRWPSSEQMRQMLDAAVAAAQPSLVLWYSFNDILTSGNPAEHWQDLVSAVSQAQTGDPDNQGGSASAASAGPRHQHVCPTATRHRCGHRYPRRHHQRRRDRGHTAA